VIKLLAEQIRKTNDFLPPESRVQKFISAHKEFDPDESELTRSRKLKRTELIQKYNKLIRAMYDGSSNVSIETEVRYKDGRKSKIKTLVKVNSVYESDF
jgi:long-chain acyl-CoA synthetase